MVVVEYGGYGRDWSGGYVGFFLGVFGWVWCWVCTLLGSEISGCSLHAVLVCGVWLWVSLLSWSCWVSVFVRVFGLVGVVV